MSISRSEASAALADIAAAESRRAETRAYQINGPIVMLWGLIWMAAYAATNLTAPAHWNFVWIPADIVGIAGSIYLARRGDDGTRGARFAIIGIASFLLIGALYAILQPTRPLQFEAIPPLLIAFLYAVLGAARLNRFVLIGAILAASTMLGYFLLPAWFGFWMAAVGGGTLLVSGYWLRQA